MQDSSPLPLSLSANILRLLLLLPPFHLSTTFNSLCCCVFVYFRLSNFLFQSFLSHSLYFSFPVYFYVILLNVSHRFLPLNNSYSPSFSMFTFSFSFFPIPSFLCLCQPLSVYLILTHSHLFPTRHFSLSLSLLASLGIFLPVLFKSNMNRNMY